MFRIELCKTKAAFSAKPEKHIELNLESIKQEYSVILESPILLVLNTPAGEVVVHKYGEIIFKEQADPEIIETVAKHIYEIGYESDYVIERRH